MDPTPPLAYFTVDSALLYVLAHALPDSARRGVELAAVSGMLLSSVVFWTALAPINGLGLDDPALVASNLLLHAVAPAAATAAFLGTPAEGPKMVRRRAVRALIWPLTYGAVIITLTNTGHIAPYSFLSAADVGTPTVVAASCGAALLFFGIASTLNRSGARQTSPADTIARSC